MKFFTKDKPLGMLRILAFTLAEVIIVMGIIGIVAEMTIPGLVNDSKKQVTITQLKKNLALLNQALMLAQADGAMLVSTGNATTNTNNLRDLFIPYLKVVKKCESSETACGLTDFWCLHKLDKGLSLPAAQPRYILKDGTSIGFVGTATNFFEIYMDLNGPNGAPNRMGYDVFMIFVNVTNSTTPPAKISINIGTGSFFDTDPQGCDDPPYSNSGNYCFYRIMDNNWQINYWL